MKKLILMRHAPYGRDNRIDEYGIKTTMEIAPKIFSEIIGSNILLLCSSAPRAMDTAEILVNQLTILGSNVTREDHEILWSDNQHHQDNRTVENLLNKKKDNYETIILITHLEYSENFLNYYFQSMSFSVPTMSIEKGEAVAVDPEARTWKRV